MMKLSITIVCLLGLVLGSLLDSTACAWDHRFGEAWPDWWVVARARTPEEWPLLSLMLGYRRELDLSPEQVQALEALRSTFEKEASQRAADLRVAERELRQLLAQEPVDLPQVEAKIRTIEALRADLRVARIRTIEQGKALLTAEQRRRLGTLLKHPWEARAFKRVWPRYQLMPSLIDP